MKAIIVILTLLVIITGGIGYYSYYQYEQINLLNEQLASFENEQTARVQAVSDELRQEIQSGLDSLDVSISDIENDIDTLGGELREVKDNVSGMEESINTVSSQVETLDERITTTEENLSESIITADDIFEKVIETTVRVTDGENLIGSGFIMDTDGHVITAHHVIDELSTIYVIMYDGRISEATVVGSNSFADVAVIELFNNPSIEPPVIADSGMIRVGEPVIAIGSPGDTNNPLGLRDTVTSGVISGVNRFVNVEGNSIPNLIQVDASVNPGNSGCPLFNTDGEIVGMIIAGIDPAEGDGLNFAVASNKVKRVAESIVATSSFDYPWVGLGISDLTPEYVEDESLETINGALVVEIFSGSPASNAGFQIGDVIVTIDGKPVRDTAELVSYLGEFNSPGDELMFDIIRDGTQKKLLVVVGTRED